MKKTLIFALFLFILCSFNCACVCQRNKFQTQPSNQKTIHQYQPYSAASYPNDYLSQTTYPYSSQYLDTSYPQNSLNEYTPTEHIWVNGYFRSDGTYVKPHFRKARKSRKNYY